MRQPEEIDADRFDEAYKFSKFPTSENPHPVICSLCSEGYYTDRATFDRFVRSEEEGKDNPFVCSDCSLEYEELEHPAH